MGIPKTQADLHLIKMGLGTAMQRLFQVELAYRQGLHAVPEEARRERDLIIAALNQIDLTLGFDCDQDGRADVPTTVDIFQVTAQTSCCRLRPKPEEGKDKPLPVTALSEPVAPRSRGGTRTVKPPSKKNLFGFFQTNSKGEDQ